jgi:hypothetical protein
MSTHNSLPLKRVIIALVATAALLIGTGSAAADSQIRMPGASASFQSHGEKFRLWDLGCDGSGVLIIYQRGFEQQRTIRFNGGCHQMGLFDRTFVENQSIRYKVCVDDLGPNTCSGWRRDHT